LVDRDDYRNRLSKGVAGDMPSDAVVSWPATGLGYPPVMAAPGRMRGEENGRWEGLTISRDGAPPDSHRHAETDEIPAVELQLDH